MSDSETPPDSPAPDSAAGPPGPSGPSAGAPASDSPESAPPSAAPPLAQPHGVGGGSAAPVPPSSRTDVLAHFKRLAGGRRGVWAAVAVLCVAAGVVGSVLRAESVARTDASDARTAFSQTSAGMASTVKLALQREEELAVSTSTFFASNPKASPAEFETWAKWARTLRRFPELDNLGLVTVVRARELAAFEARLAGQPVKAQAATPAPPGESLRVVPTSNHHYYCLAAAELARSPAAAPPAGLDYCALTPALLRARDAGINRYAPVSSRRTDAVAVEMPVYRGEVTPHSVTGRLAASVGWLREVLVPSVVLAQALRNHPQYVVRLSYRRGGSNVAFTSGTTQTGGQHASTNLHNGWTVTSFGPPASVGILANGDALAMLIGGVLLSVLVGMLVFLIGTGRAWTPAAAGPTTREVPNEDLYDRLTGLPNRALMLDRADRMLARATRQSGLLVGALFIDIDWFKDVNDKLGKTAGDQLLKVVAERLANVVRAHDTVGRLGGDEFVVLVESAARGARLDSLARRVIEALHKPVELDGFGPSFFATASIGVAFGRYATPDDLLRDAQLALYAAKAAGKDRYTLFNANMRSVIEGRGVLEVELNAAVQNDQFFLLYQPIYDLASRKVTTFEALIRWRHPTQGVLPPADFIQLAEETGLMVPIGRWVLEEACGRAAAWNVAGHRVGISVNVSANQLNRDGFATDVRRALQQSGIDPSLLTLEIAETTVMRDVAAAAARLQEIKQLGVRVAIDDFGDSGYAYHSDLQRMPLDFLKVDRSSLAASGDEDYRSWLLQAILIVGRDLSLTVIAKGIETQEQLATVQAMGCKMAQGWLMGEPSPAESLDHLFDADLPIAPAAATSSAS